MRLKAIIYLIMAVVFCYSGEACAFTLTEVRVEGLGATSTNEFLDLIGLHNGADVDDASVTAGIKRAFLKGAFEEISAVQLDEPAGVLQIKVKEKDVIDSIKIAGDKKVKKAFILKALGLEADGYIKYEELDRKRAALLDALSYKGYPAAEVSFDIQRLDKPYRVRLTVNVTEGTPLVIDTVEVTGLSPSQPGVSLKISSGDIFDRYVLDAEIARLREYYLNAGYLKPIIGPYEFDGSALKISITLGVKLKIILNGNSALDDADIMGKLPFFPAGDINDGLVAEAVANIVDLYREKGYVNAQIAPVTNKADELTEFHLYIHEGQRVTVSSIGFEGVTLPTDKIKEIVALRVKDPYDPALLKDSVEALTEFYHSLGYISVAVADPMVEFVDEKQAGITFKVSEGGKSVIKTVELEGVEKLPVADVRHELALKDGAPYNDVDIADSRRQIVAFYKSRGYINCRVDVLRRNENELTHVITFHVHEGDKFVFGKTVVSGNNTVRYRVIQRELGYREGETFNPEGIASARRSLYKLGLFSDLQFTTMPTADRRMDILLNTIEEEAGAVEVSLGYGEYERMRGSLDLSYRNLFGMNRVLSMRADVDTLSNKYTLKYYEPRLLESIYPFTVALSSEKSRSKNIDTGDTIYRVEKQSAEAILERTLSNAIKWSLAYEFSIVKTYDVKPDVILSSEDNGRLNISGIKPALTLDTRDNPFNPRKGIFAGVSAKAASPVFLSEADFIKVLGHVNAYHSLARWLVLAGSARAGVAQNFNSSAPIPLVERYFLGGRDTVRGYAQDTLGPKGSDGNPTGGDSYVCANLELRWMVYGGWSITTFVDAGNVWLDNKSITPTELKYTTGAGIEYTTPVGPLRLEYGQKLNKQTGESTGEVHFSIGYAF